MCEPLPFNPAKCVALHDLCWRSESLSSRAYLLWRKCIFRRHRVSVTSPKSPRRLLVWGLRFPGEG
eukprot:6881404-Heterocapsa_arctica.AAC.1